MFAGGGQKLQYASATGPMGDVGRVSSNFGGRGDQVCMSHPTYTTGCHFSLSTVQGRQRHWNIGVSQVER